MHQRRNLIEMIVLVLAGAAGLSLMQTSNGVESATMNGQAGKTTAEQKQPEKKPLFACNMLALNVDERKRHLEVMKQLRAATKEERELSDGYAFRFASDQATILLASEFMARERLCCPFFTFEMVIEPENEPLWVRLRGAEGVKEFIKLEFRIK